MKKGLSILLVAAALFGFYGSAVNLNDILACKDYWEEAGEKSTADMNKLEDGLNQLKENEQAYLDGKDQLAEGEQALADGEAQYAKGLADYEAAPGKLAAGERKLAAGEKELAEGKESYSKLKTLISGLNKAKKHGVSKTKNHDKYWHDAFTNALKPGRQLIVKTLNDKKDMVAMLEKLTGASDLVSKASNANSYPAFDSVVNKQLQPTFAAAATALNNFADLAEGKATSLQNALNAYNGLTAAATADNPGLESIWSVPMIPTEAGNKSFQNLIGDCNAQN